MRRRIITLSSSSPPILIRKNCAIGDGSDFIARRPLQYGLGSERARCEETDKGDERRLSEAHLILLVACDGCFCDRNRLKNLAERGFIPLKDAVRSGLTRNSPRSASLAGISKRTFCRCDTICRRDKGDDDLLRFSRDQRRG